MKPLSILRFIYIISLFTGLLVISSCSKEESGNGTEEQQQLDASRVSSESDAEAEVVFNGLFDDAMGVNAEVALGGTGIFGRTTACPDVTVIRLNAPALFPVKVILDFGVNGCTGNDGRLRRGKIMIMYTNRLVIPGAMATTTFDGFYLDSTKVEGTHIIKNTSPTVTGNPTTRQFTVDVDRARLTKPNGNFIEWTSHKEITQIEGLSTTAVHHDDVFRITGRANGKVKRGNLLVLWESIITEPLIKKMNCRWIVKGEVRTVRANTSSTGPWVAVLNFGTVPICDNQATITINGVLHQITLP